MGQESDSLTAEAGLVALRDSARLVKVAFRPLPVATRLRFSIWTLLIILIASLLIFPRQMELQYSPVQSVEAVERLPLFSVLYYAWMMASVYLLLLQRPGRTGQWIGFVLVGIFSLVYRGFWDIPFSADKDVDSVLNTAAAHVIGSMGTIPFGHPNVIYTDFPGLGAITASLATLTNLATPDAVTALMLLMDLLLAGLMYLICLRLLEDPRWAGIAALLAMQGGIVFARLPFYPGTLGLVFVSTFLLISLRHHEDVHKTI